MKLFFFISIHAPTWGATLGYDIKMMDDDISIHAPTWGATANSEELVMTLNISIHAPTWGATGAGPGVDPDHLISIHAPTWGATLVANTLQERESISIHAPTWGATTSPMRQPLLSVFQSTHPRGVRRLASHHFSGVVHFNPRTHVGCDLNCFPLHLYFNISIHAPTWGAT